ncbi:MAG: hypothetical protein M0R03_02540 [Novosphingobium sp.]|nr:hypothetical protein [Novosphingobium sp.]
MHRKWLAVLFSVPLLAACGGAPGGGAVQSASARAAPDKGGTRQPYLGSVRPPARTPPPAAHVQNLPGLESVIGATPAELSRRFGDPRLDVHEGDARKLQFTGEACVLDVFLYPPAQGREPQATYVDARRASDGQDVDRAACVAALRKR